MTWLGFLRAAFPHGAPAAPPAAPASSTADSEARFREKCLELVYGKPRPLEAPRPAGEAGRGGR